MRRSINPVGLFGALLSLSLLAAACGTTAPTAEGGAEPAEPAASADVAATDDSEASSEGDATARAGSFEAVFAAVDGLDWEARTERLLELTEAEGNTVSWYASMQVDMVDALVAGFEEQYGVDVKLYRASRDSVLRRIQEEAEAGCAQSQRRPLHRGWVAGGVQAVHGTGDHRTERQWACWKRTKPCGRGPVARLDPHRRPGDHHGVRRTARPSGPVRRTRSGRRRDASGRRRGVHRSRGRVDHPLD